MVSTRRRSLSKSAAKAADSAPTEKSAAPRKQAITTEFEFMGPIGTGFMLFGLTGFVYFLCVACHGDTWPDLTWRPSLSELQAAWSWNAFAVVSGWFTFQSILYYVAPGQWVKGVKLQDGSQLEYPINGMLARNFRAMSGIHFYSVQLSLP